MAVLRNLQEISTPKCKTKSLNKWSIEKELLIPQEHFTWSILAGHGGPTHERQFNIGPPSCMYVCDALANGDLLPPSGEVKQHY